MKTIEKDENVKGNDSPSEENSEWLTRDECLRLSSQMIRSLHRRVNGARFKEQASDGAKLSHIRALIAVLQVYGGLLRDSELIDLEKRIVELEKARGTEYEQRH